MGKENVPPQKNRDSVNMQRTAEEKAQSNMNNQLGVYFDDLQSGRLTIDGIRNKLRIYLQNPEVQKHLPDMSLESVASEIERCAKLKDKESFVSEMSIALNPIIELRKNNPKLFEDISAKASMEAAGFIPLNQRISYGIGGETAHIHLAPSFEVKEQLPNLFRDGMKKLSDVIRNNEKIKNIVATSWIVGTKTYGEMLKAVGFEISDVPEQIKNENFSGETRELKMASMSREEFLKLFG